MKSKKDYIEKTDSIFTFYIKLSLKDADGNVQQKAKVLFGQMVSDEWVDVINTKGTKFKSYDFYVNENYLSIISELLKLENKDIVEYSYIKLK